jgi:Cu/Ag efflux pump CusA
VTYEIRRENLRNISAVTARLEDRDLGSAVDEIQRRLPQEVQLPAGTDIEYGGLFQIQQESFLGLTQVLLSSILLIFIILVFEFRSFSHPIAILAATILCGFGALLALYRRGRISLYPPACARGGHPRGRFIRSRSARGLCRRLPRESH